MRRPVVLAIFAMVLQGCGGGGLRAAAVPAPGGSSAPPRESQSSNANTYNRTLWYGDSAGLTAQPIAPFGWTAQIANEPGTVPKAMTVSSDGTVYALSAASRGWKLNIYPPAAQGTAAREQVITGAGASGVEVVLFGDGIGVLSSPPAWAGSRRTAALDASATLNVYHYGAGDNPSPFRTLHLGAHVTDVALDPNGRVFAAHDRGLGISVYATGASGRATPVRTIATSVQSIRSIAVAPDGTVYARDANAPQVLAFAPGANGPAPSRTIQLFTATIASPGGITVDSDGNLYVAFDNAHHDTAVFMFPPDAQGAAPPVRYQTPTHGGFSSTIAVGPTPLGAPQLYVGSHDTVNAFPATADGAVSPLRTYTTFFGGSVEGVAAGPDGTLLAVETFATASNAPGNRVVIFPPNDTRPKFTYTGTAGAAAGLAREPKRNGFDVLAAAAPTYAVEHFPDVFSNAGDWPTSTFSTEALPPNSGRPNAIAVDRNAHVYVSSSNPGFVKVYPGSSTGNAVASRSLSFAKNEGPIAVGPDGTLYVVAYNADQTADEFVYEFAPGWTSSSTPVRTLGPFSPGAAPGTPAALAVDDDNVLYVGFNYAAAAGSPATTNSVEAFAPFASGAAAPIRTLQQPLPNGRITSIAVGAGGAGNPVAPVR